MALIIETGTGAADSQSYATVAELRAYAALRGATVPTTDAACEALLIKAMDYLEDQVYQGDRVTLTQALSWPRYGAYVEMWPVSSESIPRQLVQAQCALAIEAQTVDLMPTQDIQGSGPVTSETVGPISVTYANTGNVRRVPAIARADALLRTLLRRGGLTVIRA